MAHPEKRPKIRTDGGIDQAHPEKRPKIRTNGTIGRTKAIGPREPAATCPKDPGGRARAKPL